MLMQKDKGKLKIFYIIVSSFIFIFGLNILFNNAFISPILNAFSGDISSLMQFDMIKFVNVALILIGETMALSGGFFAVSKMFFN